MPKEVRVRIKNVGSRKGEGELSSVAEEETVEVIPGSDSGHSQDDEGSLADAESTSDTLAYEGIVKNMYTKKMRKGRYQNGWINMCVMLLLFATTRSVFKSVKLSVVEIAKHAN